MCNTLKRLISLTLIAVIMMGLVVTADAASTLDISKYESNLSVTYEISYSGANNKTTLKCAKNDASSTVPYQVYTQVKTTATSGGGTVKVTIKNTSGKSGEVSFYVAYYAYSASATLSVKKNGTENISAITHSGEVKIADGLKADPISIHLGVDETIEIEHSLSDVVGNDQFRLLNMHFTEDVLTSTVTFSAPTSGGCFTVNNGAYAMGHYEGLDPSTVFTLVPSAAENYAFDYWTVDGTRTELTDNKITASDLNGKTLSAVFRSTDATVNFANTTGGTYTVKNETAGVSVSIDSASATGSVTKNEELTVTLDASESAGYRFAGWYNGNTQIATADKNSWTITLKDYNNQMITAHWDSTNVTTTFVPPTVGGSIQIDGTQITSSTSITDDYRTEKSWVATPAENYHFVRWMDTTLDQTIPGEASTTRTLNGTADHTVTAEFAYDYITQTFPAVEGGTYSITPPADSTVSAKTITTTDDTFTGKYNETYTVEIGDLEDLYSFVGWDVDGTVVTGDTYSFSLSSTQVIKPVLTYTGLKVTFQPAAVGGTYTVKQSDAADSTKVTVSTADYELKGDSTKTYTLNATASASNYEFAAWKDLTAGNTLSTDNPYTGSLPNEHTIIAVFRRTDTATFQVGSTTYQYLDLAIDALTSSNKIITVIADGAVAGSKGQTTFTIPSGYTLLVPYNDDNTVRGVPSEATLSSSVPTGVVEYENRTIANTVYRTLTVPANTEIIVEGTLNVGGMTHPMGTGLRGAHGVIQLDSSTSCITIKSGATLFAWGYIKGDGSVSVKSGGTVYEDFNAADYPGSAGNMDTLNSAGVFAMKAYTIDNVQAEMTLDSGATDYGFICIYGEKIQYNTFVKTAIGNTSSAMLQVTSGSITKSYKNGRQYFTINGAVNINSLKISISFLFITYTVDSSSTSGLPIPSNWTVNVKNGTVQTNNSLILLAGSEVYLDSGSTFKIPSGKNVYVFDADEDPSSVTADAKIDVNGTIEVTGGFYTSASGANIISSNGTGIISYKAKAGTAETVKLKNSNTTAGEYSITSAQLHNSGTDYTTTSGAVSGDKYTWCSIHNKWEKNHKEVTITYNANGGTGTMASQTICSAGGTLNANKFTRDNYTFLGWNTNKDATTALYQDKQTNVALSGDTTLYAIWQCSHSYGEPAWTWSGTESATAVITCSVCGNELSATASGSGITITTTAPTCTEAGSTVYTATVTLNGKEYSDTQTVTTSALGHSYTYSIENVTWSEGYTSATLTGICANDASHTDPITTTDITSQVLTDPTCTEGGRTQYNAEFTLPDGSTKLASVTVTGIPAATGHNYSYVTYTWSWNSESQTYDVTGICTCAICGNEHANETESAVYAAYEQADDEGYVGAYTATFTGDCFETQTRRVNLGGVTYTAEKLDDGTYTVTASRTVTDEEGASSAISETKSEISGTVTLAATCTTAGTMKYAVTFDDAQFGTWSTEEAIAATGHSFDYANGTFIWAAVGSDVKVYGSTTCSVCGSPTTTDVTAVYNAELGKYVADFGNTYDTQYRNAYTVTFDANGGTATYGTKAQIMCENVAAPLAAVETLGYTAPTDTAFSGWENTETGKLYGDGDIISIDENITLVAQWVSTTVTTKEYTINWINSQTGETIATQTQTTLDEIEQPIVPSYLGYDFTAWDVYMFNQSQVQITALRTTGDVDTEVNYIMNSRLSAILKALMATNPEEANDAVQIDLYTIYTASGDVCKVTATYAVNGTDTGNGFTAPATVQVGKSFRLTADDTYEYNGETYYFDHWDYNGTEVSSTSVIVRPNAGDIVLQACYVSNEQTVEQIPKFYMSDKYAETINGVNKVAAVMIYDVPDSCSVTKLGFYYATSEAKITGETPSTTLISGAVPGDKYGSYTLHIPVKANITRSVYVRPYANYVDSNGDAQIWLCEEYYELVWQTLYDEGKFVE